MNKKILISILVLVAVGIVYYVVNKKPWGINYKDIADFAIEDTSSIDKIFIVDREGNNVTLTKKENGYWLVNNNKRADNSKMELLLFTMKTMKVLRPVSENEHNTAIGNLATEGIKAEFYSKNNTVKTLYIGSSTPEQNGTYMLIEGSSKAYATHIPGFFGFLTTRFISDSLVWRDRTVFNYTPEQIKKIEINYGNGNGFIIDNTQNNAPQVLNLNNTPKAISDIQFVKYYVGSFKQLNFDGYDENQNAHVMDSLHNNAQAFCTITVTDINNQPNSLTLYAKPIDKHTKQLYDTVTNKAFTSDQERYWAFMNSDKSLMLVQQFNFGRVLKQLTDFK
ncbi:MAG: DUF4340 domain-containing protein [Bacteroidota bacterium]